MTHTVVVPCFNEARRLLPAQLLTLPAHGVRLVFVDDGSTDGTRALLEPLVRAPDVALCALSSNVGKGEAVRQGFLRVLEGAQDGVDWIGFLDADLSTPPEELLRLIEVTARPGVDMVIGARVALAGRQIERRPARHYLGRIFATVASLTLGCVVYDTQCGAKLFRATPALRAAMARPFTSRWVFDVELLARLLDGGATGLVEVPLEVWRDVKGSKLHPLAMVRAGIDLLRLGAARLVARRR